MDMDFEIEIEDDDNEPAPVRAELPENYITVGTVHEGDVEVYIRQSVYKELESYSAEDISRERGAILVGDYSERDGVVSVIISGYIEAEYTDSSSATLTFTHKTWEYVHCELERNYPDKKIIGWQHTHPDYGVFLSGYDMFIHENFFNLPFQIAYVIDPVRKKRGFFQWKGSEIEKLAGYHVYDETGVGIGLEDNAVGGAEEKRPLTLKMKIAFAGFVALCAAASAVLGWISGRI